MGRLAAGLAAAAALLGTALPARADRLTIPRRARELVVVSSATAQPLGAQRLATLRAYARAPRGGRWRLVFGPWATETGSGGLVTAGRRREGDHATPIGVFDFGHTIYGVDPAPGGLHYRYRRLSCGDWWDEDPYSALYNRFTHVPCGTAPSFGGGSEALWTETRAYPYFMLIDFNIGPITRGAGATGSGIFLHGWVNAATAGCVALPVPRLLRALRWLRPAEHPMIEIGPDSVLARI